MYPGTDPTILARELESLCLIYNVSGSSSKTKNTITPSRTRKSTRAPSPTSGPKLFQLSSPVKKVTFASTVHARRVLHVNDYSGFEIYACWYDEEEEAEERRKCVRIISKIVQGKAGKYCVRGLDRMTPKAVNERDGSRMDAYLAVLREQNTQFMTGQTDAEAIAKKYEAASAARHRKEAYQVGCSDAKVARKCFESEWKTC